MNLADYDRHKFELAEILRGVRLAAPKLRPGEENPERPLFARLAEDRFNLVVVGRFSRGKSSLMNAILGVDRLPTGIVPLTSVITSVSYGSEERVALSFEGRTLESIVSLEELPRYITQEGNPGNRLGLRMAEIQLPAEILRRGFYFIDTPGLGSPTLENTRTTEGFLYSADAFLLVTGYEGPLSEDELRFLVMVRASARRIFVAVNKQDTVNEADRVQVLAYARAQLDEMFGSAAPELFSTSALQGLRAKQQGDPEGLAASGIVDLETALVGFLVNDKSREFLLRMCDRIEPLVRALPDSEAQKQLGDRLAELRGVLTPADGPGGRSAIGGLAPAHSEAAGGCEICRAIEEASFEFLRHHQYDLTISEVEQDKLAQAGGLCALHTWSYNNVASPHGVTVGYPQLLERWRDELLRLVDGENSSAGKAAAQIQSELPNRHSCVVCQACDAAAADALRKAADALNWAAGGEDRLSAICLTHLIPLLRLSSDAAARALLRRQAGLFERVSEDMRRYALKREGLRRQLASGAEDDAALRGLRLLAGLRNVNFTPRLD